MGCSSVSIQQPRPLGPCFSVCPCFCLVFTSSLPWSAFWDLSQAMILTTELSLLSLTYFSCAWTTQNSKEEQKRKTVFFLFLFFNICHNVVSQISFLSIFLFILLYHNSIFYILIWNHMKSYCLKLQCFLYNLSWNNILNHFVSILQVRKYFNIFY